MTPHQHTQDASFDQELTVEIVEAILDSKLPAQNKDVGFEPYDQLIEDLSQCGIYTAEALSLLLDDQQQHVMALEVDLNKTMPKTSRVMARRDANAYFIHVGLVRVALGNKFGTSFDQYLRKMAPQRKVNRRRRRKQRAEAKGLG